MWWWAGGAILADGPGESLSLGGHSAQQPLRILPGGGAASGNVICWWGGGGRGGCHVSNDSNRMLGRKPSVVFRVESAGGQHHHVPLVRQREHLKTHTCTVVPTTRVSQ